MGSVELFDACIGYRMTLNVDLGRRLATRPFRAEMPTKRSCTVATQVPARREQIPNIFGMLARSPSLYLFHLVSCPRVATSRRAPRFVQLFTFIPLLADLLDLFLRLYLPSLPILRHLLS